MLPENNHSGSPESWLQYANSDLELACVSKPQNVLFETLCFHAQQAAEKAVKALLIAKEITFPKTHSIRMLLDLLPPEIEQPLEVQESAILTDYAVISRYPGDLEAIDEEEYQRAVNLAKSVVEWAESYIQNR
ncbi:MAG: HEPN domain-containing protein [Candidatus Scalinduaceae bacterium]